jgi:hypothetical protein
MKLLFIFLFASSALAAPLYAQSPKDRVSEFFNASNKKDAKTYQALFTDQVAQFFLVKGITQDSVYSLSSAWFKKHPDEHYAPEWSTFKLTEEDITHGRYKADVIVEYFRDASPQKPYRMYFDFRENIAGMWIHGVTMSTL